MRRLPYLTSVVIAASMLLLATSPMMVFAELPSGGLGADRNGSDSFNSQDLLVSGINGMLDPTCGGYCVVGACAHLNWSFSIFSGIRFYTIISPQLRHPFPELLVTSYNHVGREPYLEWRETFGGVMGAVASSLGVAGGRGDPTALDDHQSGSFKEVDIIGNPLNALPDFINTDDGSINPGNNPLNSLDRPNPFNPPDLSGTANTLKEMGSGDDGIGDIDIKAMIRSAIDGAAGTAIAVIMEQYQNALLALRIIGVINDLRAMVEYFKSIKVLMDTISTITEATVRGSFYGNFTNPTFRVPRLFCPTNTDALQPYYISFADFFWWRSSFPVTDGPFDPDGHTLTVLNPFSSDTLPSTANSMNPVSEVWGRMYPRDGTLNQSNDAKTASVLAWRGMEVLQSSIPGSRVGVPLPAPPSEGGFSVGLPQWQMIYPELKSCKPEPYYESSSFVFDFMEPNEFGSYAWNYYRTYQCCSNNRGYYLASITLPVPLCITMSDVLNDESSRNPPSATDGQ